MTKEEFINDMTYLSLAFNKEYTHLEIEQHYDFLKDYNDLIFMNAIKKIIKTSKFLPKINELIEACESCAANTKFEILDIMQKDNYFKSSLEVDKATNWLERGTIPEWFQNDMKIYYKKMKQEHLEHKQNLLIERK